MSLRSLAVLPNMLRRSIATLRPLEKMNPAQLTLPKIECDLWGDNLEERQIFVEGIREQMDFWQRDQTFDRLQGILQKEPFLHTPPVQQMTLHLYSAGRKPLGRDKEYWKIEILSTDLQFRRDVVHDGHLSVTALYSEQRYYCWDFSIHNMSGFHSDMQEQITQHESSQKF